MIGQNPQDPRLRRQRHIGNFIKIQRAAIGQFEQAGAHLFAARLFAEQFLFEPFGRDPGRIDQHKGPVRPRAPGVQQPRGDFLAGARRAGNQHPAARARHPFQGGAHGVDGGRIAGEFGAAPTAFAQTRIFAPQPFGLGRAFDQKQQAFSLKRLFDEVHRPAPHRRHRRVDIAVARKDDHRQIGFTRLDRIEQFQPVHRAAVQPHIEQHQTGAAFIDGGKRGGAVSRGAAGIAFIAEHAGHQITDITFIINDEDF